MKTIATLTCPKCETKHEEKMPTNACQYFYSCGSCGETFKPATGECCVFCSYADTKCPPEQQRITT